jgi:hypothetical protein
VIANGNLQTLDINPAIKTIKEHERLAAGRSWPQGKGNL